MFLSSLDYRLVIICSNKDEEKSHMISKLHMYRRHYIVPPDASKYQQYLRHHFITKKDHDHQAKVAVMASQVDQERCLNFLCAFS